MREHSYRRICNAVIAIAVSLIVLSACEKERPRLPAEDPRAHEPLPPAHFDPIPGESLEAGHYEVVRVPDPATTTRLEPAIGQGLRELHTAHHAEARLAELALERPLGEAAAELATMVVREHREADVELLLLADDMGIPLAAQPVLTKAQVRLIDALTASSNAQIDRRLADQLVALHTQQVIQIRALRQRISNERVRAHLDDVIGTIHKHLARAKTLQRLTS